MIYQIKMELFNLFTATIRIIKENGVSRLKIEIKTFASMLAGFCYVGRSIKNKRTKNNTLVTKYLYK